MQLLREYRKIFIFVTHDPRIALLSDFRIVMQGGRVTQVLTTSEDERGVSSHVNRLDDALSALREKLRMGLSGSNAGELERIAGGGMRVAIFAGPATTGKTSVLRHATRKLLQAGHKPAFLKLDVQYADEDELLAKEFGIPTRKVYSGELCPDHCNVMVLGDGLRWAEQNGCDMLLVETAGLCLRCSPYVDGGLGLVVLEATSGMNLPLKVGPMLSLADVAVVTKIDRVSQAEREVFRARIQDVAPNVRVREVNALHGIGIDPLVAEILEFARDRRAAVPARQSAGGHLHDLRRQEGDRLAVALRRGPGTGKPDVLSRRIAMPPPHLLRQRRHHAARPARAARPPSPI